MLSLYFLHHVSLFLVDYQSFFFILWSSFDLFLFTSQITLLYLLFKLSTTSNPYKKVFLLFFILWVHGAFIFFFQAEVFACFLLVNELMVCLFIFLLMIYCGFDSLEVNTRPTNFFVFLFLLVLVVGVYVQTPLAHYLEDFECWDWQDYYLTLICPTFNDLVAPFYFFYYIVPQVLLLVGFFLFILSIVYLFLFFKILSEDRPSIFKQNNNTQAHPLQKPSVSFFKTTFNDL